MCGIFGYVGRRAAAPIIIQGLQRLEYRGYDSAGIAVLNGAGLHCKKRKGKVRDLAALLKEEGISGSTGLGHTRWATHGIPNDTNAHPHLDGANRIAVVHNGIIENYMELKAELEKEGFRFRSETDSEVIVHLIDKFYRKNHDLETAVRRALTFVHGAYAIGVIHQDSPDRIIAARVDSPLIVGIGEKENFISSDIPALLEHTDRVLEVENGEMAVVEAGSVRILDAKSGRRKRRESKKIDWSIEQAQKKGFPHFMLKEIFEQPDVLTGLIRRRIKKSRIIFDELKISAAAFKRVKTIEIVACGTSYHAGLAASYAFEELLPYPVSVETSSEFRYRTPKIGKDTLLIVISQSGETADTLAALREAKARKALTLAVCNVLGSTIAREADGVIFTHAGPEIAVASTKAYTAQLASLYLLAFYLRGTVWKKRDKVLSRLVSEFGRVPAKMREFLNDYEKDKGNWEGHVDDFKRRYDEQLEIYIKLAPEKRKRAPNGCFLYLGRNINYPSALEGALKLKEISYISAEGYPAGEMKHGPIALIDENPWVICIAVRSRTYEKMISNIQEIKARGGLITAIVTKGDAGVKKLDLFLYIEIPAVEEILSPLLVALPLQLIAYSVAKKFGEEIDQPRNLAKSVTVE